MTEPHFDNREFRDACGQFPTGVTAVTASAPDGRVAALTINSFTSVSLDPPKVLFCLVTSSSSYPTLQEADVIAVHILREDQEDLARRFATSGVTGEDKLSGVDWSPGPGGVPVIEGTAATLIGAPEQMISSGDHIIVLVDVGHVRYKTSDLGALRFYRGQFVAPGR